MNRRRTASRIAFSLAILFSTTMAGGALAGTTAHAVRPAIVHRYRITTPTMYYTFAVPAAAPLGR